MRLSGCCSKWKPIFVFGLALGCGQTRGTTPAAPAPPSAGSASGGAAGAGALGSGAGGAADHGSSGEGGDATPQGGSAEPSGSSGSGGSSGAWNPGGASSGGPPEPDDPLAAWPSAGCGRAPEQQLGAFVRYEVQTSGAKAADATGEPGGWSYAREYFVSLPQPYEPSKAYPLVLEGPGCGGNGTNVYALRADGGLIRVGLSPPPDAINHADYPGLHCFDDAEGDDSVDWPFYEAVMNQLNARVCYDRRRVWAAGTSSGALFANELACKYAGNRAGYSIRGVVTLGGIPTNPASMPTCSGQPLAGIWIGDVDNQSRPFVQVASAVTRAMQVNSCTGGTRYDDALYDEFPLPGLSPTTCKQVVGCPATYPVVVCPTPGTGRSSHEEIAVPGFAKLVQLLAPP